MRTRATTSAACLVLTAFLAACGGGGGGGGGGFDPPGADDPDDPPDGVLSETAADEEVITYSSTDSSGGYGRTDLVHGGNPDSAAPIDVARRTFFATLASLSGIDFDGDLADLSGNGVPDSGFDSYMPGLSASGSSAASAEEVAGLIFGANNLYDAFQVATGQPDVQWVTQPIPDSSFIFTGFDGSDFDSAFAGGDAAGEGGPGLFSNIPGSTYPTLPTLPNSMGLIVSGSGRGSSVTDQHQFVQIVFPYDLDVDSLFKVSATLPTDNSFLGDSKAGAALNVFIEARSVQHPIGDGLNAVDQTFAHTRIPVVAVIGGIAAVPTVAGLTTLSRIEPLDVSFANVPVGARARIMDKNVLTFIAHEDPKLITPLGLETLAGLIKPDPMGGSPILVLPSPVLSLAGGRVFGGNTTHPGSVNDFGQTGDQDAAAIGFMSIRISHLRSGGKTIEDPYFHSFPFSQANVGTDSRAVNGSFNRGPAIEVSVAKQLPGIDILDLPRLAGPGTPVTTGPSDDAIGTYNPVPDSDDPAFGGNTISTRPRFRVDFDREVVPNSVGFSRHHTVHSATASGLPKGVVFPFNGNVRPIPSPLHQFVAGSLGSPLAPSIYLAVNQPAGIHHGITAMNGNLQKVNSPGIKQITFDDGTSVDLNGNGLVPQAHNTLATLPRGVVPIDIRPLNQNNLQSYIIEPLVELPPGCIVTLGVTMPGLGWSGVGITNHGNHTRSGTVFTPWQGLTFVGLGDEASLKSDILGNETIIKVNAGPMDLQGNLFYGGTSVAIDQLLDGQSANDFTTGGFNVNRTFQVGKDNVKKYVNAPVSPQAIYLGFSGGGAGILDLSGTGYNTNAPGGAAAGAAAGTQPAPNYLEVSRFLPAAVSSKTAMFNWNLGGSVALGHHFNAFGILGRYTSGGSRGIPSGVESDNAIGGAISTGPATDWPGINEGSSGYETLVSTSITGGIPSTSTQVLADFLAVGVVSDIEVGDFLDRVLWDDENPFSNTAQYHRTYNSPLNGPISNNTISDPPFPNPPPLRFPVGLPHTSVMFDQSDLTKPPTLIEGNEVFSADGFMVFDDGTALVGVAWPTNGFIQLNPTSNTGSTFDQPHLPNPGFLSQFGALGSASSPKFVQTGPMPKTGTAGAIILAALNSLILGSADSGGLVPPVFQSRQQIGNYLFVADDVNNKLLALNSNTMEVMHSLKLPDPTGLGLSADLEQIFVTNHADNSVSVVDADPTSPAFMTELKRIPVGLGPRAVALSPDNEDAFVLNFLGNSISIVDVSNGLVRKTLNQNGINRPFDIALGMREAIGGSAFGSGTFHGFISNEGANNVLVYQSGPDGLAGIGFDDIVGSVRPNDPVDLGLRDMFKPQGITFYPNYVLDTFGFTVGAIVAHKDEDGRALASAVIYTKDGSPGQQTFNTGILLAGFGATIFEVKQQFKSTFFGQGLDVALPDFNRERLEVSSFGTFWNLFNAGGTIKNLPALGRNSKYPVADNLLPATFNGPRWEPDRLYLSVGNNSRVIEVFDLGSATHLKTITTPSDVKVMTSYFSQ